MHQDDNLMASGTLSYTTNKMCYFAIWPFRKVTFCQVNASIQKSKICSPFKIRICDLSDVGLGNPYSNHRLPGDDMECAIRLLELLFHTSKRQLLTVLVQFYDGLSLPTL
jgi:hypothetical protein